jgi:hypothetical protein
LSKILAFAFILTFLAASCIAIVEPVWANSEDSWTEKAPMQQARGRLGVAVVNGRIYTIGGDIGFTLGWDYDIGTHLVVGATEEYDPKTDLWTTKTPMPTARKFFAIAVYQNKIYCIGGSTRNSTTTVNEVYDPATDTWETKSSMPTPRIYLRANVVGDKIYLIGGGDNNGLYNLNEVYNPQTDAWSTKAPLPVAVWSYSSAVAGNKIYIMGGIASSVLPVNMSNQIYDPKTDNWSFGAPTPSPDYWGWETTAATTGVNAPERIYVFDWQGNQTLTYVYDPLGDSWATGEPMPFARGHLAAAVVDDRIYTIGGITLDIPTVAAFPSAVNKQYTPIGYSAVSLPSPSPTVPEMNPLITIITIAAITCTVAIAIKKKLWHPIPT